DHYAARAIEVLTQLRRDGYFRDPAKQQLLDKDEDLATLRSREGFKRWRNNSSTNPTAPPPRGSSSPKHGAKHSGADQTPLGGALVRTR
ncbi:MAG TPA: hypothetical protein VMF69_23335, partial [Gemmataceae bacterium]|nr:hypothetical protein [Gemmataceae bacterium]